MAFRLVLAEAPDLTTIRVVGHLGDDAAPVLGEACGRLRRPLVLDLSELMGASDAGVQVLRQLAGEGVHLLGASRYVRLLLEPVAAAPDERSPGGGRSAPGARRAVAPRHGRRR
jgi:hypothetical protein